MVYCLSDDIQVYFSYVYANLNDIQVIILCYYLKIETQQKKFFANSRFKFN